ncbi:MAG: TRAP transporter small permease [Cloacibacillus porcorum]|nr:TRAP transporter small permease [Cloacibacillus porcorum]
MAANSERIEMAELTDDEVTGVRKPDNLFDKITVSFYSIVCFCMSMLLVLIISAATIMRYFLQMDLYGYEEWVKIFAFWLYFMGAGYGSFAGTHVSADLVQSYMRESRKKDAVIFIRTVITFGVTLLFTWYGWEFFIFGFMGPLGAPSSRCRVRWPGVSPSGRSISRYSSVCSQCRGTLCWK